MISDLVGGVFHFSNVHSSQCVVQNLVIGPFFLKTGWLLAFFFIMLVEAVAQIQCSHNLTMLGDFLMESDPLSHDISFEAETTPIVEELEAMEEEEVSWERRYTLLKRLHSSEASEEDKFRVARLYINDLHPSVRYVAVLCIRDLSLRDVVDLLIYCLSDSYEWVRIRAIEGLGNRRDPEAIEQIGRAHV